MDTSEAEFNYVGVKPKRVRPDMSRLLEEIVSRDFKISGRASAAIGASVGYSAVQIRRFCLQELGEPLGSFCNRLRLERAAGRLIVETLPVADIAQEAGYKSSQAFDKAFRLHFGCTPSLFRLLNGDDCHLPGYLLSLDRHPKWEKNVKVQTGPQATVTFIYDGPIFLGRRFSNGRIDWTLP
jgi:AraC-like DNA-binding protein